ncbi:MAG: type VI secretion system tube protein Hcp [Rubrivivax sp.]
MARSDMFLKVTGQKTGEILGESNDKAYPNQIELVDWSWGMSAPTAVGGQRTGRTQMHELKVVKNVDRASTALMSVLANNETLTKVILTVRKAGGPAAALAYFKCTLEQARVNSYEVQSDVGPGGAPTLTEHVAFGFQRVTFDYTPQLTAGGGGGATSWVGETAPNT